MLSLWAYNYDWDVTPPEYKVGGTFIQGSFDRRKRAIEETAEYYEELRLKEQKRIDKLSLEREQTAIKLKEKQDRIDDLERRRQAMDSLYLQRQLVNELRELDRLNKLRESLFQQYMKMRRDEEDMVFLIMSLAF